MNLIRQKLVKGNHAPLNSSILVPVAFVYMLTVASFAYSTSENSMENLLGLRISTLQASDKGTQKRQTQTSDFCISWGNIISQQPKVQLTSWILKSISSSQRFSPKKPSIKIVSKHLLRQYQSHISILPAGWPLKQGRVSSKFGWRGRQMHKGIDIAAKRGTPILAVEDGVVVRSKYVRGYGRLLEIKHGEMYLTRYAHNSKNIVKVGQKVKKGQLIALVGSTGRATGSHLHFEIRKNGVAINPIKYLGAMDTFNLAENLSVISYQ